MRKLLIMAVLVFVLVSCTQTALPPSPPERPQDRPEVPATPEITEQQPAPVVQEPTPAEINVPVKQPPEQTDFTHPFLGNESAKVTIIEYADYSNDVNSRTHFAQVAALKRDYIQNGKVKLVVVPYTLSKKGDAAAEAAYCMWEQGSKQFVSYQDTMFQYFSNLDNKSLVNYVDRIGNADKAKFQTCINSGRFTSVVQQNLAEGKAKGFTKVPVFVIGDEIFSGDVTYSELKAAIKAQS